MNRLQANICLLCVTLCWSLEVILYSCVPSGVPAFATSCVTCFAGAALLLVPFRKRVAAEFRAGGWRFVAAAFVLAALSAIYNTLYIYGLKSFDVASGAFTFSMTVVVLPVVYPEVDAAFFTRVVFGNTAVFPIVFGMPLTILMQEEFGFVPCDRRLRAPAA